MVMTQQIKKSICSLFEVIEDERGVSRVLTPISYGATGDSVVIRIRPSEGNSFVIDDAGDAALFSMLAGGDTDCDTVQRWTGDVLDGSPVVFEDETLHAVAPTQELIAPYLFRVAEAAQQLYALSTSRATRQQSNFKEQVRAVVESSAAELGFSYETDVVLPIAGGLEADFVIPMERPLIVIAANSLPRLLEAEIIHMQYQLSNRPGFVLAVAESQAAVGKKQFERANYYTDKTVSFNPSDLRQYLAHTVPQIH